MLNGRKCDCMMLGLEVTYSTGDVVQHGNVQTAADGRRTRHAFSLEDKERIIGVEVNAGWMIDQLTFTTTQRKIGPFGGPGGGKYSLPVPGLKSAYLAYLVGRVANDQGDTCIRHLEFVWAYCECQPCT